MSRALERATVKLGGVDNRKETQRSWKALKVGNGQDDQEKGNGIILQLLNSGSKQPEIVITNPESTPEEKQSSTEEKAMHNQASVDQRRAVSKLTKDYVGSLVLPT